MAHIHIGQVTFDTTFLCLNLAGVLAAKSREEVQYT